MKPHPRIASLRVPASRCLRALTLSALLLGPGTLPRSFAQGSLTPPPGPPGPTMKSLDQIESRTPIESLPYTISAAGSYYLTRNLSVTSGDGITISSSDVSVDLNGFTISSTEATPAGTGILFSGLRSNLSIRNGTIRGNVNIVGGSFTGSGFLNGIGGIFGAQNTLVSHVAVAGCMGHGINLSTSSNSVENCTVRMVAGTGINSDTVQNCTARNCGTAGIFGTTVTNCDADTVTGTAIFASTATNCKALTSAGTDSGLIADCAVNCIGESNSSGFGISGKTVRNCKAFSRFSKAIKADIVEGCHAVTTGAGQTAIEATIVSNSYGETASGLGISAVSVLNSVGKTTSGSGILASNVMNSTGTSGSAAGSFGIQGGNFGVVQNSHGQAAGTSSIGIQARVVSCSQGTATAIGVQGITSAIGCFGQGTTPVAGNQFLVP